MFIVCCFSGISDMGVRQLLPRVVRTRRSRTLSISTACTFDWQCLSYWRAAHVRVRLRTFGSFYEDSLTYPYAGGGEFERSGFRFRFRYVRAVAFASDPVATRSVRDARRSAHGHRVRSRVLHSLAALLHCRRALRCRHSARAHRYVNVRDGDRLVSSRLVLFFNWMASLVGRLLTTFWAANRLITIRLICLIAILCTTVLYSILPALNCLLRLIETCIGTHIKSLINMSTRTVWVYWRHISAAKLLMCTLKAGQYIIQFQQFYWLAFYCFLRLIFYLLANTLYKSIVLIF